MPSRGVRAVLVSTILALLAGCASTVTIPVLTSEDLPRLEQAGNFPHRGYRIESGDTLQIRYTFHQEMNQEVTVQPDGRITAQQVGDLTVAGMSTQELERLLVEKTSDRLRRPEVIVSITRFSEKSVFVGGEVGRPGIVPYRRGITPLQAIMAVGGFRDTARLDSVILVRGGADAESFITRRLDLGRVVTEGTREPLHLAPNDVVYVPRTPIADANLWVRQHITDLFPLIRGTTLPLPMP
jgi:polysaccharide export outer membrane protein